MVLRNYLSETWAKVIDPNKRFRPESPRSPEKFHEICRALPEFETALALDNAAQLRESFGDLLITPPDTTSFYTIADPMNNNGSVARMSPIDGANKWLLQIWSGTDDWETVPRLVSPQIARRMLEHSGLIAKTPHLPNGLTSRNTRQEAPDSLAGQSGDQFAANDFRVRSCPALPEAIGVAGAQGSIPAGSEQKILAHAAERPAPHAVGPARRDRFRKSFGTRRAETAAFSKLLKRNDPSAANAGEKSPDFAQVSCRHEASFKPVDTSALRPTAGELGPARAAERRLITGGARGPAQLPLSLQASLIHFQDEANGIHLDLASYPALNGSNVSEIALLADADELLGTADGKTPGLAQALRAIIEGAGTKYPDFAGQVRHRHKALFGVAGT